ncbi:hypothetical protein RJ641_031235, partial [Dillenia turbinata]
MLLRSSSTPVLGSLLSSFADTPNNITETNNTINHLPTTTIHQCHKRLSFHQSGSLSLSCSSSPISPSIADLSNSRGGGLKGFRRAQSEGNLDGLASASCDGNDELHQRNTPQKISRKPNLSVLQTIPSFSLYHSRNASEHDEEEDGDYDEEEEESEEIEEEEENYKMSLVEERVLMNEFRSFEVGEEQPMYFAKGLVVTVGSGGFGGGGGGGRGHGGDFTPGNFGGESGGGDGHDLEEYYRRTVEENPGNPLLLRNYAQFLRQSKQDLEGAEEFYSRAILVDPQDGEILSQYARLVWELHHDQDRASSYFERAVQAAPNDSHVHAAYANFLWETEDDRDEDNASNDFDSMPSFLQKGSIASAMAR